MTTFFTILFLLDLLLLFLFGARAWVRGYSFVTAEVGLALFFLVLPIDVILTILYVIVHFIAKFW